jgi:hypothetical protein
MMIFGPEPEQVPELVLELNRSNSLNFKDQKVVCVRILLFRSLPFHFMIRFQDGRGCQAMWTFPL